MQINNTNYLSVQLEYDFPPEVVFHSRVVGACPVTTDCFVAMSYCENNDNNNNSTAEGAHREGANLSDLKTIPGTTPLIEEQP